MEKLEKIYRSGNLKDFQLFFKSHIKNYCSDNGVEIVRNLIHCDNEDNKFKLFKFFIDYLSDKKFIKISDDFLFKISSILIDNNYMDLFKYAVSKKFYISSDNCVEIIRKLIHSDNEDNKFELFKYFIDRLKNRSYLIIKIFKEVYKKQDADFIEYLEKKFHIKEILLIEACGKNNLEWVKYLVRNGANINGKINNHNIFEYFDHCTILDLDIKIIEYLLNYANEENYKSALFICCENNYFELVKYILTKGIDINIKNRYEKTPLIIACLNEHLNLAEYLIKNGADINIKDKYNENLLFKDRINNNFELSKLLIDLGIDINTRNNKKETPLYTAFRNNNFELVKYLINNNAYTNIYDQVNLFRIACENDNLKLIKYLLEIGFNIDKKLLKGTLLFADKNCDLETVEYLTKIGFNIKIKDLKELLFMSIINNNFNRIKCLADNGINMNCFHYRPLMYACINGDLNLVKLLLDNGADINAVNHKKNNSLHFALNQAKYDVAEFLLDNGADINNRDSHGQTSLIKYSKAGNYNAVKLLIKYKADINIKDNDGHDALYYAELYKKQMTIELLVKYKV